MLTRAKPGAKNNRLAASTIAPAVPAAGRLGGGWIRQRRLERSRRALSDPQLATKSIGFVRMCWDFVHASDFARAFRTTFGVPPSTYRHTMLHEGLDAARQLRCSRPSGDDGNLTTAHLGPRQAAFTRRGAVSGAASGGPPPEELPRRT
ncbi:helix-turn-helix domain-containing protein [Streptomyces sp. NPDC056309]|uniref:helix-turn-helix domain-containing protein n=1 Tax=unclassified Streptomyces TaxID=2593676 RepID=UPI0035E3AB5F